MSSNTSALSTKEGSPQLQRGKACLSCRRRKMRCDGARPYCTQCIRGNRSGDCEYTDNQGRTRTQILEENIALLQARIDELERPESNTAPIRLHDPYEQYRQLEADPSDIAEPRASVGTNQVVTAPVRPGSAPVVIPWWEFEEPPVEITDMLVDNFMPFAFRVGFTLNKTRFRDTLRLPTLHPARPHPALLYTVFLWALHLSQTPDLMQHESLYLQHAILSLQDALSDGSDLDGYMLGQRRIHAIQAEILLAKYLFGLGRLLEGRYHASAAVSLAVSCGLHRIGAGSVRSRFMGLFDLEPARDTIEFGERVCLFWEVYSVDRCWSAALGAPCALADGAGSGMQIDTPWPREIEEYDNMNNTTIASFVIQSGRTVQNFFAGQIYEEGSSRAALCAKASALYERSARLAALCSTASQTQAQAPIQADVQVLSRTITQFVRGLVPIDQLDVQDCSLFIVHGLAHTAMIALHSIRASALPANDMSATNAALLHASESLKILERVTTAGITLGILDPMFSVIGLSAAQTFVQELDRIRHLDQVPTQVQAMRTRTDALHSNINRVISTLRGVAGEADNCPIFAQQAAKIEDLLTHQ